MHKIRITSCTSVMNDEENYEFLKKENFDLGIVETFEACGLGLFEKLGLKKYILTHSGGLSPGIQELSGSPIVPSMVPIISSGFTDKMTFAQRIGNFLGIFVEKYILGQISTKGPQMIIEKYFPDFNIMVTFLFL